MCLHGVGEVELSQVYWVRLASPLATDIGHHIPFCTRICAALVFGFFLATASSFFFILHICVHNTISMRPL